MDDKYQMVFQNGVAITRIKETSMISGEQIVRLANPNKEVSFLNFKTFMESGGFWNDLLLTHREYYCPLDVACLLAKELNLYKLLKPIFEMKGELMPKTIKPKSVLSKSRRSTLLASAIIDKENVNQNQIKVAKKNVTKSKNRQVRKSLPLTKSELMDLLDDPAKKIKKKNIKDSKRLEDETGKDDSKRLDDETGKGVSVAENEETIIVVDDIQDVPFENKVIQDSITSLEKDVSIKAQKPKIQKPKKKRKLEADLEDNDTDRTLFKDIIFDLFPLMSEAVYRSKALPLAVQFLTKHKVSPIIADHLKIPNSLIDPLQAYLSRQLAHPKKSKLLKQIASEQMEKDAKRARSPIVTNESKTPANLTKYDDVFSNLLMDSFFLPFSIHKMGEDFSEKCIPCCY